MGNAPAANFLTALASPSTVVPYLNHAMATFVPEDSTFATNFAAATGANTYQDPDSLTTLAIRVTADNWQSTIQALGATSSEPIWTWLSAYWNPLGASDPNTGVRSPLQVQKSDYCIIGRRTRAVQSVNTFEFTNNTAGRVRIRVNRSQYLYSSSTPAGALADVTVVADGVLTPTQLATAAANALSAVAGFAAHFTATPALGVVTVESIEDGYPLILEVTASTPGPTMTQAITTANVAGDYTLDLAAIQTAVELQPAGDAVPHRVYYWVTDLQGDDVVNAEGLEWAEDQEDNNTPPLDYQFVAWSTSGARLVTIGGNQVGNFNPSSTDSAAETAAAANGGAGWTRGSVWDHPRYEFLGGAILGRTIAYLPGEVSFTSKVLQGAVAAAKMSPLDYGNNETLTLGDARRFNYYSNEGPGLLGQSKWGYTSDGFFMDQKWTTDYVTYQCRVDILAWMQANNIITYTNNTLEAGAGIIALAIAKIPAVIPDSIGVAFIGRDEVNPANIVARIYYDYAGNGQAAGVINRFGTPSQPIPITILNA
jgi:hypothetical protein